MEDREGLLAHYGKMRAGLLSAIEGLGEERLVERTLDGWSVKDHLAHVAMWDEMRAGEVERVSAGHGPVWHPGYDRLYDEMNGLRKELSLEQVMWELSSSHERLLAAIASASERGLDGSLYAEAGLVSRHEGVHTFWIRRWRSGE